MKDRTGAEYPTNRPSTRPAPPAPPNLAAPISEGAGPLLPPGGDEATAKLDEASAAIARLIRS